MQDDSTRSISLQALRREVRAARVAGQRSQQHPVFVEDVIIARLIEAHVNLAVAAGQPLPF